MAMEIVGFEKQAEEGNGSKRDAEVVELLKKENRVKADGGMACAFSVWYAMKHAIGQMSPSGRCPTTRISSSGGLREGLGGW